jgi:hypothetical protein
MIMIVSDQNIDRVRCCFSSISVNEMGLCICRCSDAQVRISMKRMFSERRIIYLTPLYERSIYSPSAGPKPLLGMFNAINDCRKTAEEPWWAINVHHYDVGRYNMARYCDRWAETRGFEPTSNLVILNAYVDCARRWVVFDTYADCARSWVILRSSREQITYICMQHLKFLFAFYKSKLFFM